MIDYNDPDAPNYDPYWGDKETSCSGLVDDPSLSDFEIDELEEMYIQEMREAGLLRPTLVRREEQKAEPESSKISAHVDDDGEVSF
jgi:hypothetical protein